MRQWEVGDKVILTTRNGTRSEGVIIYKDKEVIPLIKINSPTAGWKMLGNTNVPIELIQKYRESSYTFWWATGSVNGKAGVYEMKLIKPTVNLLEIE